MSRPAVRLLQVAGSVALAAGIAALQVAGVVLALRGRKARTTVGAPHRQTAPTGAK